MKHYEATLPFFCGFYDTWPNDLCSVSESNLEHITDQLEANEPDYIDANLHADFKRYVEEVDQDEFVNRVCEAYMWEYDRTGARSAFCDRYAKTVCDMLGIPHHGQELTSPRYYNYETDKIHMKLDALTLEKWVTRLQSDKDLQEIFEGIIEKRCTSYDGFTSFHSNALEDYLELTLDDWDNIKVGLLLEAILYLDCPDDMADSYSYLKVFEEELLGDLQSNGFSDDFCADINKILAEKLAEYRDKNPDDDYIKPLPAKYLKGEVVTLSKGY